MLKLVLYNKIIVFCMLSNNKVFYISNFCFLDFGLEWKGCINPLFTGGIYYDAMVAQNWCHGVHTDIPVWRIAWPLRKPVHIGSSYCKKLLKEKAAERFTCRVHSYSLASELQKILKNKFPFFPFMESEKKKLSVIFYHT